VGGRYVSAKNTYEGSITDIMVDTPAGTMPPGTYLAALAAQGYPIPPAVIDQVNFGAADISVKAEGTGTGITPIVGLNLMPADGVNIGFRYEHKTALELELTADEADARVPQYGEGVKIGSDLPAMVATGVSYQATDEVKVEGSFTYYMNTDVDWDGREDDVENGFEGGAALEYAVTDVLTASGGFLYSSNGAEDAYNVDSSFSLDSYSLAAGVEYEINDSMILNLGVSNVFYDEGQNGSGNVVSDTYNKTSFQFAIGIGYIVQ
jgi:long-subunit fatty acid transport protein